MPHIKSNHETLQALLLSVITVIIKNNRYSGMVAEGRCLICEEKI
jgi:hypothetical protein